MNVRIKRVYEPPASSDGERVLVDRLWPRGLSKAKAKVDLWLKEIAPSSELRIWFDHDPAKWQRFRGRYRTELKHQHDLVELLREKAKKRPLTLLYATHDKKQNQAVVLKQFMES